MSEQPCGQNPCMRCNGSGTEPNMGPRPIGRVNCPSCQRLVDINRDGRLRHHRADGKARCPASRQPAPGGSIVVRQLSDGVVIRVRHAPGTFADEAVTDELPLTEIEWAELAAIAAPDATDTERERIADLADLCHATYPEHHRESASLIHLSFAWLIRQNVR